MTRSRKRRREVSEDSENSDDVEEDRSQPKSSPGLDSQNFAARLEKVMNRVKGTRDDVFVATFKGKVEKGRKELESAIVTSMKNSDEQFKARRAAAVHLTDCIPASLATTSSSDSLEVPVYMTEAKRISRELGQLCTDVFKSYHATAQKIESEGAHLAEDATTMNGFEHVHNLLRAGISDTAHTINEELGFETRSPNDENPIELLVVPGAETSNVPQTCIQEWRQIEPVEGGGGNISEDDTIVVAHPTCLTTYDAAAKKVEKYSRRLLKDAWEAVSN